MCGAPVEKKEYYAWTGWTVEDVLNQAAMDDVAISEDEALELLKTQGASIDDAMIQVGWNVISYILQAHEKKGGK
jgi:hypothetical protein